jgi:hypothetical protein
MIKDELCAARDLLLPGLRAHGPLLGKYGIIDFCVSTEDECLYIMVHRGRTIIRKLTLKDIRDGSYKTKFGQLVLIMVNEAIIN